MIQIFLIASILLISPNSIAFGSSARPRVDTEAWDIKETSPADPRSTFTMIFRLTFGQTHQRVFFATIGSKKSATGVLTQESRTGHTAASIDAANAAKITKQLSDFTSETKYARPGKYWSCQYPLDFTFAQKTTLRRCREMLTPEHKKSFSKIVNALSLESKR
jgi:hypothetical protein